MKELLLSNGRVLDGKRGKRGTRLAKIPHPEVCSFFFPSNLLHQPSQNHFFVPFVSVCLFLGSHCFGVARVLQCRTSPVRDRLQ
jgi:hypothetical protein